MCALRVSHLCKKYAGFELVDVSFHLPRGYIMGLIGENGAGKTTVIKSILNVIRRSSGEIRILGLDLDDSEVEIKERIGVIFDEPPFYEDVSLEDLKRASSLFYRRWREDTFQRLCQEFQLPLEKKFKHLSQGMKTKLALALALSHEADLLILDEPTSGLDPAFRRQLLHALQDYIEDGERSVLFSTHITSDLEQVADFITFIQRGRVVLSTSCQELEENWALCRGGQELLLSDAHLFESIHRSAFQVEALTRDAARAREELPKGTLFEKASLEDIMVLYGRSDHHA